MNPHEPADDRPPTDAAPRPPALDSLTLTIVVDNETDSLSSIDAEVPQIPEVGVVLASMPPSHVVDVHPCIPAFAHTCVACHGLSILVEATLGDRVHTMLFDVGPRGDLWLDNAHRLGVDLAAIETVFLSHWHSDHSGGFPTVVGAIARARGDAGLAAPIVDLHPDRPDQRGVLTPDGSIIALGPEPTLDAIGEAGGDIRLDADPHAVCGGLVHASGRIPRRTDYETGLPGHHSIRGDEVVADPLILDERFLAAEVAGRGVTVLSACSHAGVVNACLAARQAFPDRPVDAVVGGYHLAGAAMEDRIGPTVADLATLIDPRLVAPGHCTGWRAKQALATAFGSHRYGPSVVGSRYQLAAPH